MRFKLVESIKNTYLVTIINRDDNSFHEEVEAYSAAQAKGYVKQKYPKYRVVEVVQLTDNKDTSDDGEQISMFESNGSSLADDIFNYLKNNYSTEMSDRGFILPDGIFISCDYSDDGRLNAHYVIDDEVVNHFNINMTAKSRDGSTGSLLLDKLGCVRVNGTGEDYIALPSEIPTLQQYRVLEEWIDDVYFTQPWAKSLSVATSDGQYIEYDSQYSAHDIVNKIRRYYTSGILLEKL